MLAATALAALLITTAPQDPVPGASVQDPNETRVDDIVVLGRPLNEAARDFVYSLAVPARGRGLARWRDTVCVGVVNLRGEAAQYLADVISTRAEDLGLKVGAPGCSPNVVITFADDGAEMARAMVRAEPAAFRVGGSGMDLGRAALGRFQEGDAAVRWWHMALPINSETGRIAVRIPGETDNEGNPSAPSISTFGSLLTTIVRDDLNKVIVIVDVDGVAHLTAPQLADYLSMVALAQIDPRGDTSDFPTILNVLDNPAATDSMTDWDLAFLEALYRDDRAMRRNPAVLASSIASDLARGLRAEQEAVPEN